MAKLNLTNKKAQIWGMDLFIAATIFAIGLVFFYLYAINYGSEAEETIQSLTYEGGVITETILSEGYPEDWNFTNVIQIGILTNGKINETKLERFYNLTLMGYPYVKSKLNTPYDFYFFLDENMTINSVSRDGIGKLGYTRDMVTQDNLVRINRITIYKNKVMGATLYLWK